MVGTDKVDFPELGTRTAWILWDERLYWDSHGLFSSLAVPKSPALPGSVHQSTSPVCAPELQLTPAQNMLGLVACGHHPRRAPRFSASCGVQVKSWKCRSARPWVSSWAFQRSGLHPRV